MNKKHFYAILTVSLLVIEALFITCDNSLKKYNPEERSFENSYKENPAQQIAETESPYIDNHLFTGEKPYSNSSLYGNDSQITITTASQSNCDLVAIVKHNGVIVRNAYINAGDSHTFHVPNGTYQVFFYAGKGWNPQKPMPNSLTGGFVTNESYSKDSPMTLDYESITYELYPQVNGNFSTKQSSAIEIF